MNEFTEDKTCRICGSADMDNFSLLSNKYKPILEKISSVFPIIVYKSDPLPKNICPKCFSMVSSLYDNIQRVVKIQKIWINNVRMHQPTHSYIRVLDLLEESCESIGKDITEMTNGELQLKDPYYQIRLNKHEFKNERQIDNDDTKRTKQQSSEGEFRIKEEGIKEIKSILESNGCSLLQVVSTPLGRKTEAHLKKTKIKCKICPFEDECIKKIAQHQIAHLYVPIVKIFQTKYLDKKCRRGRLIWAQNQKQIRCVNCWKTFSDNKVILDHWSDGKCDFYCHICGKEFPESPRMLREHVPAAHDISYRSSKQKQMTSTYYCSKELIRNEYKTDILLDTLNPSIDKIDLNHSSDIQIRSSAMKSISRSLYPKVRCQHCHKVFANFKAKNSHMRAHKHRKNTHTIKNKAHSNTDLKIEYGISNHIEVDIKTEEKTSDRKEELPVMKDVNNYSEKCCSIKIKSLMELQKVSICTSAEAELIYDCQTCGAKFSTKLDLFRHKRKCPINNQYSCQHCFQLFSTSSDMNVHIMLMH